MAYTMTPVLIKALNEMDILNINIYLHDSYGDINKIILKSCIDWATAKNNTLLLNLLNGIQDVVYVEETCYDRAIATGYTCINPYCSECK